MSLNGITSDFDLSRIGIAQHLEDQMDYEEGKLEGSGLRQGMANAVKYVAMPLVMGGILSLNNDTETAVSAAATYGALIRFADVDVARSKHIMWINDLKDSIQSGWESHDLGSIPYVQSALFRAQKINETYESHVKLGRECLETAVLAGALGYAGKVISSLF